MAAFSVDVGDDLVVEPGRYEATTYAVEPDAAAASYFFAAAAITGGLAGRTGPATSAAAGGRGFVRHPRADGGRVRPTETETASSSRGAATARGSR